MALAPDNVSSTTTYKSDVPYNFNDTLDGSFVTYYTWGRVNYADVVFLVNGVLDESAS